jgi:hypothetical protein
MTAIFAAAAQGTNGKHGIFLFFAPLALDYKSPLRAASISPLSNTIKGSLSLLDRLPRNCAREIYSTLFPHLPLTKVHDVFDLALGHDAFAQAEVTVVGQVHKKRLSRR